MPPQPNTKLTRSSQPPPFRQTSQQTPLTITIDDDSSTESESNQGNSSLESDPDQSSYYIENQLGLEEFQHRCLHDIPEVPEPAGESQLFEGIRPMLTPNLDKIDCGVQVSQNEPVAKDDVPVDAEMFSSLDGQVGIFV